MEEQLSREEVIEACLGWFNDVGMSAYERDNKVYIRCDSDDYEITEDEILYRAKRQLNMIEDEDEDEY